MAPLTSLLALTTLFIGATNASPITSITKQPAVSEPAHFTLKARRGVSPRNRLARRSGVALTSQADLQYFTTIQIGTPPQPVEVTLDTGSTDLWVAVPDCNTEECTKASAPLFDPTKSTSLNVLRQQPFVITYGKGNISGPIVEDTVSFAGQTIQQQGFIAATKSFDGVKQNETGLMGLAFVTSSNTGAKPFWLNAIEQFYQDSPLMSFYLARQGLPTGFNVSTFPETPGGVFTLGGTNSSLYTGDIEYHSLSQPRTSNDEGRWLIDLGGVTVNDKALSITPGNYTVLVDSGTTAITGPSDKVAEFYSHIPGAQELQDSPGQYVIPCNSSVDASVSFGGKSWPISGVDFNEGPLSEDKSDMCLCLLTGRPSATYWIFGDVFMKNVYSVFRSNPPAIGFAQLASSDPSGVGSKPADGFKAPSSSSNSSTNSQGSGSSSGSKTGAASSFGPPFALVATSIAASLVLFA